MAISLLFRNLPYCLNDPKWTTEHFRSLLTDDKFTMQNTWSSVALIHNSLCGKFIAIWYIKNRIKSMIGDLLYLCLTSFEFCFCFLTAPNLNVVTHSIVTCNEFRCSVMVFFGGQYKSLYWALIFVTLGSSVKKAKWNVTHPCKRIRKRLTGRTLRDSNSSICLSFTGFDFVLIVFCHKKITLNFVLFFLSFGLAEIRLQEVSQRYYYYYFYYYFLKRNSMEKQVN